MHFWCLFTPPKRSATDPTGGISLDDTAANLGNNASPVPPEPVSLVFSGWGFGESGEERRSTCEVGWHPRRLGVHMRSPASRLPRFIVHDSCSASPHSSLVRVPRPGCGGCSGIAWHISPRSHHRYDYSPSRCPDTGDMHR